MGKQIFKVLSGKIATVVLVIALLKPLELQSSQEGMLQSDPVDDSLPENNVSVFVNEDVSEKKGGYMLPLGPLFIQKTPQRQSLIIFPFFFHELYKKNGIQKQWTGLFPFYLYQNSSGESAFVVFPVLWNFNLSEKMVFLVPPIYLERKDNGEGTFVFAPLLFLRYGSDTSYQFIPPIFFNFKSPDLKFTYSLLFYRWKGKDKNNGGILPLAFWGENESSGYRVVLPVFWSFYNRTYKSSKTIFPPFYYYTERDNWKAGLIPLFFATSADKTTQITVLPALHLRKNKEEGSILVATPLGWYSHNPAKHSRGGGLLLAHFYRGDDRRVMVFAPFYYRETRDLLFERSTLVFPFLYLSDSPVYRKLSILGIFWDFHEFNARRTLGIVPFFVQSKEFYSGKYFIWVIPTIQYSKLKEEWLLYIHPIYYQKGGAEKKFSVFFPLWWRFSEPVKMRQVLFPLFWDFKNLTASTRITVFFPLMLRYSKEDEIHTLILNFYHWRGKSTGHRSWKFAMLPAFGFGRTEPDEYYWKILLGLAGFEKSENEKYLYVFWLPVKIK